VFFVDTFPGSNVCNAEVKKIVGIRLITSWNSSMYDDSMCEMQFMADDANFTSRRLMINFEKFEISDCSVELEILGTGSNVSICQCILFDC